MKIEFNALGAVSDIITNDEPLRQGNVGANTLTAVFEGKSNLAYTATFNYTRSDDGRLKDIPLTPTANAGEYYYKFSNPWFFALYGETTLTVYLKNSANEIVASGQITFPIEQTDFDDDPNITYSEYELLLDAITAKQDKFEIYNVRGYNSLALAEADAGLVDGQIIIVKGTPTEIYQVQSGALVDLIVNKATSDSLGHSIKDNYLIGATLTYDDTIDSVYINPIDGNDALVPSKKEGVNIPKATTTKNGLMAKEDKVKVDGLATTYETIVNSDAKVKVLGNYSTREAMLTAVNTDAKGNGLFLATNNYDSNVTKQLIYKCGGDKVLIIGGVYGQRIVQYNYNSFNGIWSVETSFATEYWVSTYYQPTSQKGQPNGYASLDSGGKVPSTQLPSYVDDVLEFANLASFPATGSASVIYVALDTNLTYRWSGSGYTEISPSPAVDSALSGTSTNAVQNQAIVKQGFNAIFDSKINLLNNSTWFAFFSVENNLVAYQYVYVTISSGFVVGEPYTICIGKSNTRAELYACVIYCYNSSNEVIQQISQPIESLGIPFSFVLPTGTHHFRVYFNVNNGTPSGVEGETIYWDNVYLIRGYNQFVSFNGSFIQNDTVDADALNILLKSTNLWTVGDKYVAATGNPYQATYERINDIVAGKKYYLRVGETNSHATQTIAGLFTYDSNGDLISGYNMDYGTSAGVFVEWIAPANVSYVRIFMSVSNSIAVGQVGEVIYFKNIYFGENDYIYALKDYIKVSNQGGGVSPSEETFELSLPSHIYVANNNNQIEIYNTQVCMCKNIKDYYFVWIGTNIKNMDRKVIILPTNSEADETVSLNVYDGDFNMVASGSMTVHRRTPSASLNPESEKAILCIGDSLTDLPTWRTELLSRLQAQIGNNFRYIGTLGNAPYLNEGHSGWSIASFLGNSSEGYNGDYKVKTTTDMSNITSKKVYTSGGITWEYEKTEVENGETWVYFNRVSESGFLQPNGTMTETNSAITGPATIPFTNVSITSMNPFYNPGTGSFDIEYYLQQTEQDAPDYIFLMLGTNGMSNSMIPATSVASAETQIANYKTIIDNIIAKLPNCKILVAYAHYCADQNGYGYSQGATNIARAKKLGVYNFNKKLKQEFDAYNENLFLIPIAQTFDSKYNFNQIELNANPYDSTQKELAFTDAVHPSINGFKQMADEFFAILASKL